jgi:hypothetical protein
VAFVPFVNVEQRSLPCCAANRELKNK